MVTLRPVTANDRAALRRVEAAATPKLRYLDTVFDMFLSDERGGFFVAETAGEVVACAKFTVLADGSGWLEGLRVVPAYQQRGIGKQLYRHYLELARLEGTGTLRLYTGQHNAASRGLATRFGFEVEETFSTAALDCAPAPALAAQFQLVQDPAVATDLLLPLAARWRGFAVMNRTFYALTPALCAQFARSRQVYAAPTGDCVVVGARFGTGRHLALYAGNAARCLAFAVGAQRADRLDCVYPVAARELENELEQHGFKTDPTLYFVMKASL